MKHSASLLSISSIVLMSVFSITALPLFATTESKTPPKTESKEMKRMEQNLHSAHLELATQKGKIARLEKELAEARKTIKEQAQAKPAPKPEAKPAPKPEAKPAPKPEAKPAPKPESKPAHKPEAKPAPKSTAKPAPKPEAKPAPKPEAKPAPKPEAKPAPKPATAQSTQISYSKNSAVTYKGRESALHWIQARLKQNKDTRFSIVALANDKAYPEANKEIAENRARFLVDYLVHSGVSRSAIVSTKGEVAKVEAGAAGRIATISVAPGKK